MANEMLEKLSDGALIAGAINWGLVGLFGFNAVSWLADAVGFEMLANIIYIFIGVAGVYLLMQMVKG